MQKLPVGTQSFFILRKNNYLYVDKTKYIYKMIEDGRVYFLSRPRRFGKSLLISTIEELFKGNKDLFKGLYIYDKWKWNEKYSVIHVDLAGRRVNTPERLEFTLNKILDEIAEDFEIQLAADDSYLDRFGELIKKVYKKTEKEVVILIDEYDKPITSNLSKKI